MTPAKALRDAAPLAVVALDDAITDLEELGNDAFNRSGVDAAREIWRKIDKLRPARANLFAALREAGRE